MGRSSALEAAISTTRRVTAFIDLVMSSYLALGGRVSKSLMLACVTKTALLVAYSKALLD